MRDTSFDCLIDEYLVYCRIRELREKTMNSYEQSIVSLVSPTLQAVAAQSHSKSGGTTPPLASYCAARKKCQASRVCSYGMRGRFFVFNQINLQNIPLYISGKIIYNRNLPRSNHF